MPFALRYGGREYPLSEGQFVIGRSETCQLCLEDPVASRNHAAIDVDGEVVTVRDLESRNGVFLNKVRIGGPQALRHGDVIRIGAQEMTLVQRRTVRAETLAQAPSVSGAALTGVFGVLGGLADKALALGRGEEAERILGRQLEQTLERLEAGEGPDKEALASARGYAARIAVLTKRGKWLDYLLRLHAAEGKLMTAELVDDLYALAPAATATSRSHLRAYLAALASRVDSFGPSERFVLGRLEGLERQL